MTQTNEQTSLAQAIKLVDIRVQELGFSHISPESLTALGELIDGEYVEIRRAYRKVIAGFQALLAPVEAA